MTLSSNDQWVTQLSATGDQQANAIADLRSILVRRLAHVFRSNPKADEAFVEDAAQDALLAILRSLDTFQGRSRFTTWATTIAIRLAITEMRRRRWKEVSLNEFLESPVDVNVPTQSNSTVADIHRLEVIEKMHQLIRDELTERQRTALQAELKGMPQEEIGRKLGSNRNAVYKLTHDARKRLRKAMAEAGYSVEDLALFSKEAR